MTGLYGTASFLLGWFLCRHTMLKKFDAALESFREQLAAMTARASSNELIDAMEKMAKVALKESGIK